MKVGPPSHDSKVMSYGIRFSEKALRGFYKSLGMRRRFASLQAAQLANKAKDELPADIEEATRKRIAQHKFELAYMDLSERYRLQLIQIQQNEDGMKGNFALKKAKLDLDVKKFQRDSVKLFINWAIDEEALKIALSTINTAEKTLRLGQRLFGDLWE